ncbi:MAG: hypothetical protein LBV69_09890 [Bacteroidales bacterium]|jgi:uncharacterized protein (DUF2141 family)|nr:hypothetical protein [Bacteroidales bacterium]
MATVTINYDARNKDAKKALEFLATLDYFTIEKEKNRNIKVKKTGFEQGIEDLEAGRYVVAASGREAIEKILNKNSSF